MQESNTFSPARSTMDYFKTVYAVGDELKRMAFVQSEIAGFLRAGEEHPEADMIPTFFTHALAAGRVLGEVYEQLKQTLLAAIREALPADGILLALHGAMAAEGHDDAEGDLIAAVRELVGDRVPIVISLDMHANVTRRMVQGVDAIVGYKTYPHVDHADTGYRAANILIAILKGEQRPSIAMVKLPLIVQAENAQTDGDGPMGRLIREAQAGEQAGRAIASSLFIVQPWLDIEEMGSSAVVVADTPELAQREAERLASLLWEAREEFRVSLHPVREMVELAERSREGGPILMSDSADSSGAGATGDSNEVLAELIGLRAHERLTILLTIVDPEAVQQAIGLGVGRTGRFSLGRKLDPSYGHPLEVEAYVRTISDGLYTFGKGFYSNMQADMGPCAVLTTGKLAILVMGRTAYTIAPEMYRSVGLEPASADLVLVKSANQFRACFDGISDRIYILDTRGSSTPNFSKLPFTKLKRPFYPFDEDFEWQPGKEG